jgi:AraC-like DNA-binding protein
LYILAVMYRALAATATVEIGDYRCGGADSAGDERALRAELVFVRSGLFEIETGRGRELVDASCAVMLHPGEHYRVSHPGACHGDHCLVLAFGPETLDELERYGWPAQIGRSRLALPCDESLFAAQERFRAALTAAGGDGLLAAEGALHLAELLLGRVAPERMHESAATGDRRVAAVRALLAARFAEPLSLADLGAAVNLSVFRLAHLFRAATGDSLHRHRLGLRLRAAATRIADGERDLTALALELGFADHAHFTNSFRRRFGVAPSAFRRAYR